MAQVAKLSVNSSSVGSHGFTRCPDLDFNRWNSGEHIQDCFPYLDAGQRELLISKVCDDCFNEMFAEEEEE